MSLPPIGLKSMQNRTFSVLLRPIFAQEMKTAPPPPEGIWCRSCEGVAVIRPEEPFELPISAEKSVSILDKPFECDSRTMKIRVKVACSCLTLAKKPPFPPFQILATRLPACK